MPNSIAYASVFNQVLDEAFAISSRTSFMENNGLGIVWQGGKEVKIPKLALQGLGTVVGCTVPNGDVTFGYETKQMQWDRGRTFKIGRYDVDETNFALNAGVLLGNFAKQHVIPEQDKLRISTVAKAALDAGHVTYEGASASSTPLKDLLADIGTVQDKIGEDVQLYILISGTKKTALMSSSEITKYLSVRDYEVRSVSTKVDAINDQYLIQCPTSYMETIFTLRDGTTSGQEAGGVVAASGSKKVNWVIVARDAVIAVGYPRVEKIITPDENQDGDCWKIMFRNYHGLFVLENKLDGLHVNVQGAAPSGTT